MKAQRHATPPEEGKRLSRRRLLATLGVGIAGAYVAPTLFSLGQAHAWHDEPRDRRSGYSHPSHSRPSYSRPSYSRPSYSRPSYSRPSGGYHRHIYHYHTHDHHPGYLEPSRW